LPPSLHPRLAISYADPLSFYQGLIAATFWLLLGNAIVATQVVEDGTMSSLVVCFPPSFIPAAIRFEILPRCFHDV
jgi:hypothetical protein